MLGVIGAGINDRNFPVANEIGVGALEGKGTAVIGDQTANAGSQFARHTVFKLHVSFEGDIFRHWERLSDEFYYGQLRLISQRFVVLRGKV